MRFNLKLVSTLCLSAIAFASPAVVQVRVRDTKDILGAITELRAQIQVFVHEAPTWDGSLNGVDPLNGRILEFQKKAEAAAAQLPSLVAADTGIVSKAFDKVLVFDYPPSINAAIDLIHSVRGKFQSDAAATEKSKTIKVFWENASNAIDAFYARASEIDTAAFSGSYANFKALSKRYLDLLQAATQ